MGLYAQFFIQGVSTPCDPDPGIIKGCGDRAVIRIDGRISRLKVEQIAEEACRARGYVAWQLIRGESLLRTKPVSSVIPLYY
jgi:hypothetical protein